MSNVDPIKTEDADRAKFIEWYTTANFDYLSDPIGGRECSLMWKAWQAAVFYKSKE